MSMKNSQPLPGRMTMRVVTSPALTEPYFASHTTKMAFGASLQYQKELFLIILIKDVLKMILAMSFTLKTVSNGWP